MTALSSEVIIGLERRLLAALYQQPGLLREPEKSRFASYAWREPLHQVIFEALNSLPKVRQQNIEAELSARLTRRGFPDIPWRELHQPRAISEREFHDMVQRLLGEMPGGAQ